MFAGKKRKTDRVNVCICIAAVCAALCTGDARAAKTSEALRTKEKVVFNEYTFWRCSFSHARPVVRMKEGLWPGKDFRIDGPPAEWVRPGFDDSDWLWMPGPFFNSGYRAGFTMNEYTSVKLALICLRKSFHIADPEKAGDLILTLHFRGGAVVYLNGKEVARAHLPEGEIDYSALADDYPREAFVKPNGKVLRWAWKDPGNFKCYQTRTRRIEGLKIPADRLQKGANLLAVEIHRAPFHEAVMKKNRRGKWEFYGIAQHSYRYFWTTAGMPRMKLTASGEGVTDPAVGSGFRIWNADPLHCIYETDFGPAAAELSPIRIAGTRNGTFAGQIVTAYDRPVRNLKASVSQLTAVKGDARIGTDAVHVFYPEATITDPRGYRRIPRGHSRWTRVRTFDTLQKEPPAVIQVNKRYKKNAAPLALRAVQPVWVRVDVSEDAVPGRYRGVLNISADGIDQVTVPVRLYVEEWKLPPASAWQTFAGHFQSPESVALHYNVPMWSERHFAYLEKAFELLGSIGNKTVYLSCIAKTDVGNSQTMLRWVKKEGGFEPDFTAIDRYLSLANKYLVNPQVVCFYVWDRPFGGGYFGRKNRSYSQPEVTVIDPETGTNSLVKIPAYDRDAAKEFWKPAAVGIKERMDKLGWTGSLMLGVGDDCIPGKPVVRLWKDLLPEARWVSMSHAIHYNFHKIAPVGYATTVWQARFYPKAKYGWRRKELICHFDRDSWRRGIQKQLLVLSYLAGERNITGGQRGFGRQSADFWPVLKHKKGRKSISARYPGNKGQLQIRMNPYLAPGPDGHVSTIRFEMIREGLQECEARIFIERALLDDEKRTKLGTDLVKRCKRLLRKRISAYSTASGVDGQMAFLGAGRRKRNAELFSLAAEAAAQLP